MPAAGSVTSALRQAACLTVLPVGVGALSFCALSSALLGASHRRVHRVYLWFAHFCLWMGATQLRVYGAAPPGDRAYVLVSNHESNWDAPVLIASLPELVLRFIIKREIARIPLFGHALRASGNVTVDRAQTREDVRRIRTGMASRAPEVSMMFFAEGTRSRDGRMRPFKKGAFATAIQHGLPLLPVGIAGTRRIWPAGFTRIRRGPAVVEVGAVIPVERVGLLDREALRKEVEQSVRKLRSRGYQRLREEGWPVPPDA